MAIGGMLCFLVTASCKDRDNKKKTEAARATSASPTAGASKDAAPATTSVSTPDAPATPFGRDVQRICDATALSGALEVDEAYRSITVAQWLAQKVESQEGRDLLGRVARLPPKKKAAELRAAATKIGLPVCETAVSWGGSGP